MNALKKNFVAASSSSLKFLIFIGKFHLRYKRTRKNSCAALIAFSENIVRRPKSGREREFAKLRTHLIKEIVGRNVKPTRGKQLKLRPAGVVALEWARLEQEV